jgi:hypothetical protein
MSQANATTTAVPAVASSHERSNVLRLAIAHGA